MEKLFTETCYKVKILNLISKIIDSEEENIIILECHQKYFLLFFTTEAYSYRLSNTICGIRALVQEIKKDEYEKLLNYDKNCYKVNI